MASTSSLTPARLEDLEKHTACDIADALLKLKVPNAGFVADLLPRTSSKQEITIGRASTVFFSSKNPEDAAQLPPGNIPAGNHYVDLTQPGTIVVLSQPKGQKCAVLGGIMALRMKMLDAQGVIVHGRVRDVRELESTGLPIWSKGTSIVGTGAEAKPYAIQIPLDLDGTVVAPGDVVFCDPTNGVVVIPQERLGETLMLLSKLVEADARVKEDVETGMTVQEAFKTHRGR
ncbi:ribonuclease E inhibitor RraA/Dimethylmenaquinone methyltransferase [Amylocarpus encephaloides]|uniref:Ribonuclease E inhibitor RraA/Dimethylmenaquinone methyltransferase n=1 Tax=Amylocarpus encephaloides TaxID=45428 RepID=A0A9P8C1N9_9HELO|nr:ribonuclease E inhibitor RraA/Dimethylmenaquinone methyltransferase [Amylocarpus encephaloides]